MNLLFIYFLISKFNWWVVMNSTYLRCSEHQSESSADFPRVAVQWRFNAVTSSMRPHTSDIGANFLRAAVCTLPGCKFHCHQFRISWIFSSIASNGWSMCPPNTVSGKAVQPYISESKPYARQPKSSRFFQPGDKNFQTDTHTTFKFFVTWKTCVFPPIFVKTCKISTWQFPGM